MAEYSNKSLTIEKFYPANLVLKDSQIGDNEMHLSFHTDTTSCNCPKCGISNTKIHTTHHRKVQDLPILGKRVYLDIKLYEFDCQNPECAVVSFTETLDKFLNSYSSMTERLVDLMVTLAMETSCEGAARILKSMPDEQRKRVLSFFGVNGTVGESGAKNSLILTQHMANLGIMPLGDQHLLYRLFADYFLEGTHITVKPHPDDIAGCYNEIFGDNATVLPFAMPSELLPYTLDGKLKVAIAAYSTAVKSLGSYSDRIICFDNRIMEDFRHLHRYFAALILTSALYDGKDKIMTNANEMLFKELSQSERLYLKFKHDSELCDLENVVIISDNLPDSRSIENFCNYLISEQNKEFIIFLNEHNRHVYFDGVHTEVFRHIRPIFIDISDKNGNKTSEVIYLYSTDEKVLSATEKFQHKKELKYTGITLDIHSISRSDSEKIRMLEGVLEATEARLKEYIANKKQLDEIIAKQGKRKHK